MWLVPPKHNVIPGNPDTQIGVSLWDMSQLCMRQCIEWGLHQPPRAPLEPLEEQRRRRIFWECYLLDRKSSGFLGLPYAIPEAEICVELPVSVDDTTIKQSRAPSLSEITDSPDSTPTELCVFLYFIRLRRITSRVHLAFYAQHIANRRERSSANAQFASTAAVLTRLNELQKELDDWRRDAPVFASPKSLYQRPEWYDFLLERDKLLLIRGAIHNTNHDKSPPTDLLTICLDVATRVIELFFIMLRNNEITWTKGYLQVIFTACLSIINCISLDVHKMTGRIAAEHPREALPLYVEMLRQFKQRVPQASSVKFIFDAVQKRYMANTGLRTSHDEVFGPIYSESTSQVYPGPKESQGQATPAADGPNVIFQSSNNGAGVGAASAELGSPFTWDHDAAGDAALAVPQMALGPEGSFEWLHVSDEMLEHLEADMGYQTWSSPRADMYVWDQLDQVL